MGQTSWAERHYVTDFFKTGLRTGPSLKNKIVHFLTSGQPVETLEFQEGWNRVRVLGKDSDDVEGWGFESLFNNASPLERRCPLFK